MGFRVQGQGLEHDGNHNNRSAVVASQFLSSMQPLSEWLVQVPPPPPLLSASYPAMPIPPSPAAPT